MTSFHDTTAAPGGTFVYKVLANSMASNEVPVTLPADGQATKTLQPGPDTGKDVYIITDTGCCNYGTDGMLGVGGSSAGAIVRSTSSS